MDTTRRALRTAQAQLLARSGARTGKDVPEGKAPQLEDSAESATAPAVAAQSPSPSMVGVPPPLPRSAVPTAPGAQATSRGSLPKLTHEAASAARTHPAQVSGVAPAAARPCEALRAAAALVGQALPVPVPRRTVEAVSRAPAPTAAALPPMAVPLPEDVPPVGPASALTALAQEAAQALGLLPTADVLGGEATPHAPQAAFPRDGPAALAVGRAVARGACPVHKAADGKLVAPIGKKYQVVFISAEVAPWSKTGGLGEAMDGLPIALAALGHRVMTISPRYDQYWEAWDTDYWSEVPMGSTMESVHAFHTFRSKVDRVFVDHACFLEKVCGLTGAKFYGPEWGKDYPDNQWRFIYFAKAALKIIEELALGGHPYGSECTIIVNDWHSAMLPAFLAAEKQVVPEKWAATRTVLLIHNAVFQGRFDRDNPEEPATEVYGLSDAVMDTFTFEMPLKVGRTEPRVKRCLNWMAAAAQNVDRNLTVSPTYAWELLHLPEMGVELEEAFALKGMTGIVNGVKSCVDPRNETFTKATKMPSTFSVEDVDEKKTEFKANVQDMYKLPVSAGTPLCVFVGRLDLQKGYDYLLAALEAVLSELELQVVIIGAGRPDLVASTQALAEKHHSKVRFAGWCGPERYAIVAGADYNLMPSRWEPCGLAQLESMRFGTLPVVAQTGGLVDTVEDGVTGLHLPGAVSVEKELDPASVELMVRALERCVEVYAHKEHVSAMRKSAMVAGREFSWGNAALQYEAVFEQLGAVDVLHRCKDVTVMLEVDVAIS